MPVDRDAALTSSSRKAARLDSFFDPQSIAVIGASESSGSRGAELIQFLQQGGYRGMIMPVNPKYESVFGLPCRDSVADLDTKPDVVAICLRAEAVAATVEECVARGLTTVAVVASGFSERGDEVGRARETELSAVCARNDVVLMGPNCVGINNRLDQVNYWLPSIFRPDRPQSGASIIMQSGALVSTAIHLAQTHGLDVDFAVSSGNEVVLRAEDYIEYILARGGSRVIGLMREGIKEPERFARICLQAREQDVAIVVLPVGRSEVSRRMSASHTGSLIGSSDVSSAFYSAFGVLEAKSIDEWISMLLLLSQPYRPAGKRIGIYSLSGGGSALLADLAADVGLELVPIPQHTVTALKKLADERPVNNPVDAGGYYGNPLAVPTTAQALLSDPELDAVAVCTNSYRNAGMGLRVVDAALDAEDVEGKPFAVFSFGSDQPAEAQQEACLVKGAYPLMGATSALPALDAWLRWSSWRPSSRIAEMRIGAPMITSGRLSVAEVLHSLAAKGVRLPERTEVDPEDPAGVQVTFPVVLKLENDTVQHKTDLGLVELDVSDPKRLTSATRRLVERARELRLPGSSTVVAYSQVPDGVDLILGMVRDPVFGPAVTIGAGGIYVEILRDSVVAMPPLAPNGARDLIDRLKSRELLAGARHGDPSDMDALVNAIVAFSELAAAAPADVRSVEINPLRVMPGTGGAWALDVLIDD